MGSIKKGSIIYLLILIATIAIFGIILYPIFDFILCKFITYSEFTYSVHNHIIQPVLFAVIFGFISWIIEKNTKEK